MPLTRAQSCARHTCTGLHMHTLQSTMASGPSGAPQAVCGGLSGSSAAKSSAAGPAASAVAGAAAAPPSPRPSGSPAAGRSAAPGSASAAASARSTFCPAPASSPLPSGASPASDAGPAAAAAGAGTPMLGAPSKRWMVWLTRRSTSSTSTSSSTSAERCGANRQARSSAGQQGEPAILAYPAPGILQARRGSAAQQHNSAKELSRLARCRPTRRVDRPHAAGIVGIDPDEQGLTLVPAVLAGSCSGGVDSVAWWRGAQQAARSATRWRWLPDGTPASQQRWWASRHDHAACTHPGSWGPCPAPAARSPPQ